MVAVKRFLDIIISLAALIALSPLFILIPLLLKMEGQGGSPFYRGERVGKDGMLFMCWKFRTMEPNTDYLLERKLAVNPKAKAYWDKYHKLKNDPRVQTKTSKIIRKFSIDELPQLINVLRGDMSLVGPRPILESERDDYGDNYRYYISVVPGITGLWQVSGRNNVSFRKRAQLDKWYVLNWSLWYDFIILFRTAHVVFSKAGAH